MKATGASVPPSKASTTPRTRTGADLDLLRRAAVCAGRGVHPDVTVMLARHLLDKPCLPDAAMSVYREQIERAEAYIQRGISAPEARNAR